MQDDRHTCFFSEEIRKLAECPSLPEDVRIICKDGQEVLAHKFLLHFTSKFFEGLFRCSRSPYLVQRSSSPEMEVVDLKDFEAEDMRLLIKWLYSGQAPAPQLFGAKVFNLITLANFLLIDLVKSPCFSLIRKLLSDRPLDDHVFPMRVYKLGVALAEPSIITAAELHFLKLSELPSDFLLVEIDTMLFFLNNFNSCRLTCTNAPCSLTAVPRELFIVKLIADFIKVDKSKRLGHAFQLFQTVRLAIVIQDLDFDKLGLEELNDATTFPSLHKLLDSVRRIDPAEKLTLGQEPYWDLWLPRQGSVKYSIWTRSLGNFRSRVGKEDGAWALEVSTPVKKPSPRRTRRNDVGTVSDSSCIDGSNSLSIDGPVIVRPPFYERFSFERRDGVTVRRIDVFSKAWRDGQIILGGIRFLWSDGSQDEAGCLKGKKDSLILQPYQSATAACGSDLLLFRIQFRTLSLLNNGHFERKTFGPFGRPLSQSETAQKWGLIELIQTPKVFKDRLYIDGLKGLQVSHGGHIALCGVSFKMSFNANFSLEHFFRPPIPRKTKRWQFSFEDSDLSHSNSVDGPLDNNSNEVDEDTEDDQVLKRPRTITIDFLRKSYRVIRIQDMRDAAHLSLRSLTPNDLFSEIIP